MTMKTNEKSPFLAIAYITLKMKHAIRIFPDPDFFLILEGSLRIMKGNEIYDLGKDDIFLFEPQNEYHIYSAGNNIILSIILDNKFFHSQSRVREGHYVCNSSVDTTRNYESLRQQLISIAYTYADTSEYADFLLISHAYRLLYYMNVYHFEQGVEQMVFLEDSRHQERLNSLLYYIHHNYMSPISLLDAADMMQLSTTYFSYFFKKNMQENFNTYINKVRLEHAVEDLVYTDKSITAITFDNGFASMNAFMKLFREKYQTTPNQYRRKIRELRQSQTDEEMETLQELDFTEGCLRLESYERGDDTLVGETSFPFQETIVVEDMQASVPVIPIWKQMLNIGTLRNMGERDLEKQLVQIQEKVGFSYARVECVMDYQLFHFTDLSETSCNFAAFDQAIDILKRNRMRPYLSLTVPADQLSRTEGGDAFIDLERYLIMLERLIKHCANMYYGLDDMESWYYEIKPQRNLENVGFESPQNFVNRFFLTWKLLKKYLPGAKVGGVCHDAIQPFDSFYLILHELSRQKIRPDFFGIIVFPYELLPQIDEIQHKEAIFYTRDTSLARRKVEEMKEILAVYYEVVPELHVTCLAPDFFQGHFLNDTCFQASFFFHNTVDLLGKVEMIGYYQLSDLGSGTKKSDKFLEGRTGIFNKYNLRKPGAHLLELFSRGRNNLVQKGADYVVLKGGPDRYLIGLCNYTYVREYESYSMHQHISADEAYQVFESPQTRKIEIKLCNMGVGDYDIILHQINRRHGSLLDEWGRNGYTNQFSGDELEYMRKTLQPLQTHFSKSTEDGTMRLQLWMEPHEVAFIALLQRW